MSKKQCKKTVLSIFINKAQFNKKNDFKDDLKVKIGLHSGFPVEENNDLFGTSVQVAARVCDHAGANQILLTHDAKEKDMRSALKKINKLSTIKKKTVLIRLEK